MPISKPRILIVAAAAACASAGPPAEAHPSPQAPVQGPSVYAPYAPLIGEWAIVSAAGAPVGVSRFRWGPSQSYIWFATALMDGSREVPHFEGLLVWNGAHRNLDMLLSIDLAGGRAQEQGTLSVAPDGSFVRDIVATFSGAPGTDALGRSARFRQTFRSLGPGRMTTSVLRQTADGWSPSFPGSDNLVMTRRGDAPVGG